MGQIARPSINSRIIDILNYILYFHPSMNYIEFFRHIISTCDDPTDNFSFDFPPPPTTTTAAASLKQTQKARGMTDDQFVDSLFETTKESPIRTKKGNGGSRRSLFSSSGFGSMELVDNNNRETCLGCDKSFNSFIERSQCILGQQLMRKAAIDPRISDLMLTHWIDIIESSYERVFFSSSSPHLTTCTHSNAVFSRQTGVLSFATSVARESVVGAQCEATRKKTKGEERERGRRKTRRMYFTLSIRRFTM